jgi:hypothetical protein
VNAERVARLLDEGLVTPAQVLRAAVLGLVPYDAVPAGAGDPAAEAANLTTLRDKARAALAGNNADRTQDETIRTDAQAIVDSTATTLTQAQLIATLKNLARGLVALAGNDARSKQELSALVRLVVGDLDSTEGT